MDKQKAAEVAAKWWTEKVCGVVRHDNGDPTGASDFANIIADMLSAKVDRSQGVAFETALKRIVRDGLDDRGWVDLDVDYHPCRELADAARLAGVSEYNFPYKTTMTIRPNKGDGFRVEVKAGYGAPWKELVEGLT